MNCLMKSILLQLVLLLAGALAVSCSNRSETGISGVLTGAGDRPLALAHIHLLQPNVNEADSLLLSAVTDSNGAFRLVTEHQGIVKLRCTAPDHSMLDIQPLLLQGRDNISLTIRLGGHRYADRFDSVSLIGDFNNWNWDRALPLLPQPDGRYTLELPATEERFAYQLINVALDKSINGTQSDSFEYDGDGDYRSIVRSEGGRVRIVFDPALLPQSGHEAFVSPLDANRESLLQFADAARRREDNYFMARSQFVLNGHRAESFRWHDAEEFREARAGLEAADGELQQQTALLNYLHLAIFSEEFDTLLVRWAYEEIAPDSYLWSLPERIAIVKLLPWSMTKTGDRQRAWDYLTAVAAEHPDHDVRAHVLYDQLNYADFNRAKDEPQPESFTISIDEARQIYQTLLRDFPDSRFAGTAISYNPDRSIRIGNPIPSFALPAFDDSVAMYDASSSGDRSLLLHFWDPGSPGCVAAIPELIRAHERYGTDSLAILSVALAGNPDELRQFRQEQYAMPWMHSSFKAEESGQVRTLFEIVDVPTLILVGADGIIEASNEFLDKGRLMHLLDTRFHNARRSNEGNSTILGGFKIKPDQKE